ncbi:hypothetical protein C0989_000420 [Termitomyces sp. Mn162]|nr:hypothetical protein C0989_000420 [Termitomyces sp. Mn162]
MRDTRHLLPSNTNWQVEATNGTQPLIPINSTNPAPHSPPGQGPPSANQPLEQCLSAQLNATDLHKALELLDANPNDLDNVQDSTDDQEALCVNKIWNRP